MGIDRPDTSAITDPVLRERLEMSLAETSLSLRTINTLERAGALTVCDLLYMTIYRLRSIKGINDRRVEEVFMALAKLGFHRKPSNDQKDASASHLGRNSDSGVGDREQATEAASR